MESSSLRYFLLTSFVIFAATGLALGYIASYFLLRTVAYLSPWLPLWMWYADISLFIQAIALAATSTVGIIAIFAKKDHAIRVCSYILVGLLSIEIAVTFQTIVRKLSIDNALTSYLNSSMTTSQVFYAFNISETQMWDEIQLENNCCGIESYKDWFSTEFGQGKSVPDSCCLIITLGCGQDIASKTHPEDDIVSEGCLPTLMGSIRYQFRDYGHNIWLPVIGIQSILVLIIIYSIRKIKFTPKYCPYIISPNSLFRNSAKYEHLRKEAY